MWLGDPATALLAVSVVSGWVYAGFYMIIFYAAFRQVPAEVIEAARLDGAGEWALFARVKVPMIRGAIAVAVLLCVTGGFQGFDLFYVITNGGPTARPRSPRPSWSRRCSRTATWATAPRWPCCSPRSSWPWASCTRGSRHAAMRPGASGAPTHDRARARSADVGAAAGRLPGSSAAHSCSSAVVFLFPMVWMVLSSFKANRDIFSSPLSLPTSHRPRALGRGVGGRATSAGTRSTAPSSPARLGDAHPAPRVCCGVRAQPLSVPGSRGRDGHLRAGAAAAAAGVLHRPVQAVHAARHHRHSYLGAHHPVHRDGPAARDLPAQGLPRRAARRAVRRGTHRWRRRATDVPRGGAAAAAPRARHGRHLLRAGVLERVPPRAPVHPERRAQDHPHGAAGVLVAATSRTTRCCSARCPS